MEDSNTLFCSSNLPCANERISSMFVENLDTLRHKYSPALYLAFITKIFEIKLRDYLA